ncbi:MAG: urea ABC transporter permease subunit UrtC [Acidimicrobiia bacterium]
MSGDAATKVGFLVGTDTDTGATAAAPTVPLGMKRARWRRPGGPGETGDPGKLRRRGLGSLAPRSAYLLFAVALLAFPRLFGTPTDARQWAEWLCYAMVAVGLDIAWGYGGMLALGQGLFFGLGAYAMAMHLSLEQVPDGSLPSFMSLYSDNTELPLLWRPFQSFWATIIAAVVVPAVVAALLGLLVFKRRIRGPYFALLTQATAVIFALVLIGNLKLTAGFNGLTGFSTVFGRNKYAPETNSWLYDLAAVMLLVVLGVAMLVVRSRYGKLLQATRDSEDRVRFLGYDPAVVKTIGFVIAAAMAGAAGAVAAPVFGIVSPGQFDYAPSILMICWVAVGGRGKLWGAVLGALVVNWTRVTVSEARPDDWQYLQGALFVVILAFAPGGFAGLLTAGWERLRHRLQPGRAGRGDRIVLEEAPV